MDAEWSHYLLQCKSFGMGMNGCRVVPLFITVQVFWQRNEWMQSGPTIYYSASLLAKE